MMQALRFVRCVRHHRAGQLARRAHKIARRALAETFGPHALFGQREQRAAPLRCATPPLPVFRPRAHMLASDGDDLVLDLMQHRVPLATPFDWSLAAIPDRPLLALFHLHAMEWIEGLDDAAFQGVVRDWIAQVDAAGARELRSAWHPFVISLRAVVWMQQSARRRRRLPDDFLSALDRSVAAQIRALEADLELDLGGNHLLKNAKALLWAGATFDGPEAERWTRRAVGILANELGEQMLGDGMHFERSPAYHAQVVADLLECRAVLAPSPLRARLDEYLRRGAQVVADLAHPDGAPSLFNDGGLHMAYAPREILDVAERALGTKFTPRPVFALDEAGYYGARRGKDYVLFDCGAIGPDHLPAHGHADALAFEWTVAGERLVVDAGVYEYRPGDMRDLARSTKSHNTVTLDDHDSIEFWSSFRVGRRCRVKRTELRVLPDGFVLEGTHDGFAHLAGAPIHRRRIHARPDDVRIEDRIEGGSGQIARSRLLLHPDCRVSTERDGSLTIRRGRARARVVTEAPIEVVDAWWFPDFGIRLRTLQLVVTYGVAPCTGGIWLRSLHG